MKLTVKTLKGGKFTVDAEPSNTIAEVKGIIEAAKAELPAAKMKLIHSGKVLKDDDTVEACKIEPNGFLVVMITKPKKSAAAPAAAPAAAAPAPAQAPSPAPAPATSTTTTSSSSSTATASASASSAPASAPTPATSASSSDEFPAEVISNLTGMGFPEAEVRACLRAAQGNPDVAVEFLMNGIPPSAQRPTAGSASTSAPSSGGDSPLAALRSHPQFNDLRRLVQSNPQMLQAVLTQIGQQQPELLQSINANQGAFLEMMNEPITEETAAPETSSSGAAPSSSTQARSPSGPPGMPNQLLEGMANPAQLAQMIQSMGDAERQSLAAMMGLTPEQLTATSQMIGQMPQEHFQEYMNMAMQGGAGGAGGMLGGLPGMMGGGGGGPQVLRLNDEEMAAVERLTDMGFDRAEAAQAYLACDKNEALAANLLMDGGFSFGADDGGDMGGGSSGGPGTGGGSGAGGGDDDGDDMYD